MFRFACVSQGQVLARVSSEEYRRQLLIFAPGSQTLDCLLICCVEIESALSRTGFEIRPQLLISPELEDNDPKPGIGVV